MYPLLSRAFSLLCLLLLLCAPSARGDTWTTLAGPKGGVGHKDGILSDALFASPTGVAVDASGNTYIADSDNAVIRKITSDGLVTTLAGLVGASDLKDGVGFSARFERPEAITVDGSGNVYVTDNSTSIRKVTPEGIVTTIAGGKATGAVDGTGSAARFHGATGIAVDRNGALYVADVNNAVIRKVLQSGVVTTFAGQMDVKGYQDGTGAGALFTRPNGITIDSSGNLFVNDYGTAVVRKITPAGVVTTLAGKAFASGQVDANGVNARFGTIRGMAVDGNGNVYVAEDLVVRKITLAGDVTTIAGTVERLGSTDGGFANATFGQISGLALNGTKGLLVVDQANCAIRRVGFDGAVSTLNGHGLVGHADGTGEQARFAGTTVIAADAAGNVFAYDSLSATIRKVSPNGVVTTLAGSPFQGGYVDGMGASVRLSQVRGIAVNSTSGTVYFSQGAPNKRVIRQISQDGTVSTLAGSGLSTGAGDGTGAGATFAGPEELALDSTGNLYVNDGNTMVRKVTPNGVVTTLAGKYGVQGNDDGPLAQALFGSLFGIALDSSGNIFVADRGYGGILGETIRKITPGGMVSIVMSTKPGAVDNLARDSAGNFYSVGGTWVRRFSAAGVSSVFAGNASAAPAADDGSATSVRFAGLRGVAVGGPGNRLYVADQYAGNIRVGQIETGPLQILQHPPNAAVKPGWPAQFSVYAGGAEPITYQWRKGGLNIAGATEAVLKFSSAQIADAGKYDVVVKNTAGTITSNAATLTVSDVLPMGVAITTQPSAVRVTVGSSASFSVTATGTAPLSFQWRKGGVAIPGATAATYSLPSVQLADAETYDVIIANDAGAISSMAATLTVSPPQNSSPVITGQPQSTTVLVGQAASFRARATGLSPIQFQWRKGGININRATFAAYNLSSSQLSDTGSYDVVITNPGGSVISSPALLTVNPPPLTAPKITLQPAPVASYLGLSATFAVTATGNPLPSYQWLKNGTNIPNATGASYTIASAGTLDAGSYSVVANNSQGSVTSNAAALTTKTIVPEKGNWRVLAGAPGGPGYADGTGSAARFDGPNGLAFDAAGNLLVTDSNDNTIRKIKPSGAVTTFAGNAYIRTLATTGLNGICIDSKGTIFYVARYSSQSAFISKLDSAGKRISIQTPSIPWASAGGMTIDLNGNIFVSTGYAIWKVSSSGAAAVFAGSPDTAGTNDGSGTSARFSMPGFLAVDDKGNIYVADNRVRIISPGGNVTTLPGTYEDPNGVTVDSSGNVWITSGRVVQKITPAGVVTTIAGNKDKEGCTDGPGATALFSGLGGIALDKAGNVFVADAGVSHTIRKITPTGVVSTFAGASPIGSADGLGTAARFYKPGMLTLDASGNAFVVDTYNQTVRKVTPAGAVTTVAGSVGFAGSSNGIGSAAQFTAPFGIAIDQSGVLFVSETIGRKVRRILQSGSVSTIATSTGRLRGIDVDSSGTIFFVDGDNNVIRKITQNGQVSTVAGSGTAGDVDGFGAGASFSNPQGVRVAKDGTLYVADVGNIKIRRVTSGGVVSTFSKGEYPAFWGQTEVALNDDGSLYALGYGNLFKVERDGSYTGVTKPNGTSFSGVAVDANGNLVLSDNYGAKIWAATLADVPLKITSQPAETVADRGTAVNFSVGATGSGPISFQWRRNGVEIPGATLPRLGIAFAQTSDAGSYDVVLSNGAGAVVSMAADLTVTIPPDVPVTITAQPVGGSVYLGSYVSFSVQTTGTPPISYQWYKDGYEIPGATAANYATSAAAVANAGRYVVTATNLLGTVTSSEATLNVSPFTTSPIVITSQPMGTLVVLGGPATFAVTGSLRAGSGATDPLTYQWRKDGVAIEGAVSPIYTIDSTQLSDSGSYDVLLTSGLANVVSSAATLTVGLPVSITTGPVDATVNAGASFALSVTPGGTGPFSYQWSKNGMNITKATSSKLAVAAATLADAGRYEVAVRNQFGTYPDNPSAQVVVKAPPVITKEPAGAQVKLGAATTLRVTATGTAPLAYQWRRNGVSLPGATLSSYTIPAAAEESAGAYDVVVGNALGTAISGRVSVLVNVPTVIVRQPAGGSVQEGSVLSLSVLAKGTGTLRYQWYKWDKAGKLTNLGTQATLPLGAGGTVAAADAGTYMVTVSGYGPMVKSEQVVVEVRSGRGIAILEQPSDMEMLKGTALTAFVRIDANGADVRETRYTLCRISDGAVVPTAIEGSVPANGAVEVPLRSFAESQAVVRFTRNYSNGATATAQTQPFSLTQHSWAESAGTYEAVLLDMNSPVSVGDAGLSRGFLTVTLTRTGAISGRLFYVEAGSISGAPRNGLRAYQPVLRSFSGSFTPSQGESTVLVSQPKLGVGAQEGRQELALELNIAGTPPALKATVKDNASLQAPAFVLSRAENCTRSAGTLPSELAGLVGRYVLAANESLPTGSTARDNNAYLLTQVLASGKVLWNTRLTGYSGSGSAGLNTSNPLQIVAPFYESRLVAGATLTTASALLGRLVWEPTLQQTWNAAICAGTLANQLEKQSSQLAGARSGTAFVPVYEQAKFDDGTHSASVQLLDFRDQIEGVWGATPIAALFPVERALTLRVSDPLTQPAADFSWSVTVSSTGVVRAAGLANGGMTAPPLSLRLDQTRGEWLGSYVSGGTRRTLTGTALDVSAERGRGWVEIGPNTGRWRLELAP